MKTIAISFHGTERIQVPDDKAQEFCENLNLAYKALLKQFNIQNGDIDIDYIWNEDEEKTKVVKEESKEDIEKEEQTKALLDKMMNDEISEENFNEELKKIYN